MNRADVGRIVSEAAGVRANLRDADLTAWRPVHVRKIGPWWGWYCQLPDCLDSAFAYGDPGRAADAGREHHRLWHTDLPVFARYRT